MIRNIECNLSRLLRTVNAPLFLASREAISRRYRLVPNEGSSENRLNIPFIERASNRDRIISRIYLVQSGVKRIKFP